MRRRDLLNLFLAGGGAAALRGAAAATPSRPLFLHGAVTLLTWADPQPRLDLLQREDAREVLWAWERKAPRLHVSDDLRRMLADAVVPPVVGGGRWAVALPSLARLSAAGVPRPKIGDVVGILGAWRPPLAGQPAVDALACLLQDEAWAFPPVGAS